MRRKKLAAASLMAFAAFAMTGEPGVGSAAGAGTHVLYINGISTFGATYQYQWAPGPVRDGGGIPQPTKLPPVPRASGPGCDLQYNTGPYPADPAHPDLTKGEVGINPPCAGTLSATSVAGPQGCVDASDPTSQCSLNAPTWFYGFCGQTYGGDTGGLIHFGGKDWTIQRMGFPAGQSDTWEFNGRIANGSDKAYIRFYFTAYPNKLPDQGAGCAIPPHATSIEFVGTIVVSDNAMPRAYPQSSPGWYYCDGTDTANGC